MTNDVQLQATLNFCLRHDLPNTTASGSHPTRHGLSIGTIQRRKDPSTTPRHALLADDRVCRAGDRIAEEIGTTFRVGVI